GHYRAALAQVEIGLARCPKVHGFGSLRAMLHAIEAFLRYERNELDGVRDILDETLPLLAEQGTVDPIVLGYVAAGRSRMVAGDFGTALDILSEGELIGVRRNFPRLTICLRAERALLLSRSGALNQARALLEMPAAIDTSHPGYSLIRDRHQRMKARFALISGDGEQACTALWPLIDEARTGARQGKLCEFLILRALAEDLRGNQAAAFEALTEALELGSANGYFRTFVDEGRALDTLTDHWLKRSKPTNRSAVALATRLLEFAGVPRGAPPEKAPDIALNKRERQILRLLDEGLTNAQVAGRCFISEGTVKWYLHNLYEKCGVGNRTGLLRHVRALGLKL
ncbi:MAG: LuxR C-terminal-related transcriptional regulator, partial [Panacagrimonas sp.]